MDAVDKQIECRESTRQETSPPPMIILECRGIDLFRFVFRNVYDQFHTSL